MPSASITSVIAVNIGARPNRRKTCFNDPMKDSTTGVEFGSQELQLQAAGGAWIGRRAVHWDTYKVSAGAEEV